MRLLILCAVGLIFSLIALGKGVSQYIRGYKLFRGYITKIESYLRKEERI